MNVQEYSVPSKNPCPCCGHLVFEGGPGTDEICPVCFWQDDMLCLLEPFEALGPNKVSLHEAQTNFASFGLCDSSYTAVKNRLVAPGMFSVDKGWRLIDRARDRFAGDDYPADRTKAYYWRPDYWLRSGGD